MIEWQQLQQTTPTSGISPVVESITPSPAQVEPVMAFVPPAAVAPPPRSGVAHRHKLRVAVQFRARTLERSHFDIYKAWLETNPLQAIIAGDGGDDNKGGEDDGSSSSQRPTLSIKIKIQQNSIERTIQLSPSWVAL